MTTKENSVFTNVDDIIHTLEKRIEDSNNLLKGDWTKRCVQVNDIIKNGKEKDLIKYFSNNIQYQQDRKVDFDKKDWSSDLSEATRDDILNLRKRLLNVFLEKIYVNTDKNGNILYGFPIDIQYSRASYNNKKKEHKDEVVSDIDDVKIYFHAKIMLFNLSTKSVIGETTWSIRKIKKADDPELIMLKLFNK